MWLMDDRAYWEIVVPADFKTVDVDPVCARGKLPAPSTA